MNEPTSPRAMAPPLAVELDMPRLQGLGDLFPPGRLREFVELYLLNSGERVDNIRAARAGGDLAVMGREAHTMISTSGNIGAMRVSELAMRLEQICRDGERDAAIGLAGELCEASVRASAEIRAWLDKATSACSAVPEETAA